VRACAAVYLMVVCFDSISNIKNVLAATGCPGRPFTGLQSFVKCRPMYLPPDYGYRSGSSHRESIRIRAGSKYAYTRLSLRTATATTFALTVSRKMNLYRHITFKQVEFTNTLSQNTGFVNHQRLLQFYERQFFFL
jgi:hypothetical protein